MCGIVGIISKQEIDARQINMLTETLRHRGPDAQRVSLMADNHVAFGHTRLSIIDVSNRANQPMHSVDERYTIVFNGEIYNFREVRKEIEQVAPHINFKTTSDTEVVLVAFQFWGAAMVQRLQGMFAIAIFDNQTHKTFLFRDRMGKKPLFYFNSPEYFIFASEIKALLKHPAVNRRKEIDQEAVHDFLHVGYIPEPKTIFRSIRKFPAGFVGEIHPNLSQNFYPFWKAEDCIEAGTALTNNNNVKRELSSILEAAVNKRLISDVPLGAFLSGGTDSSLVCAIAAKLTDKPLKTFNIGFKENKSEEHVYASKVATHLKTDHHEYILSEDEAASILEKYLHHLDEPFADTSAIPTMLVSKLAREQVTVALTGDGGDELFLGYGSYTWANRLSKPWFKLVQTPLALGLRLSNRSRFNRIAHLLESVPSAQIRSHIFSQEQYFFSDAEIHKLITKPLAYQRFKYQDSIQVAGQTEAEKQALFDLKFYLKDDLLVKVDRASMYYSLECRCPILDQDVVKFALNLPEAYKKAGGTDKWILKEILQDYIPRELVYRPKSGFSIPLSRWLKGQFQYLIEQNLNKKTVEEAGFVKFSEVERLLQAFMNGEEFLYNRIWLLIVLHKWLKQYA